MRLVETVSHWGNGYKFRYFANGKRITEAQFDNLLDSELRHHAMPSMAGKSESFGGGYRTIWQF